MTRLFSHPPSSWVTSSILLGMLRTRVLTILNSDILLIFADRREFGLRRRGDEEQEGPPGTCRLAIIVLRGVPTFYSSTLFLLKK